MVRTKENGMCCGAGGGLMWAEETTGNRINVARTEQALEVNPTMISSACPFCLTMLSDGTKAKDVDQDIGTMDVAEILALSVFSDRRNKNNGIIDEERSPYGSFRDRKDINVRLLRPATRNETH